MADVGLPALYALFVWWFSTGVIIWLDGLPRRTYRWSMGGATLLLAVALWGLSASADDATVLGATCAFTCGLLVWAWQEMAFLMGYVTGPVRDRCPEGLAGWPRFTLALRAILWHELAVLAGGAVVLALTWGGANPIGLYTYLLLWGMRQSAKFNVFLGVRNLSEKFLPPHMQYLGSFFARRPMNLLFPFSVTFATLLCALLFHLAFAAHATDLQAAGFTYLGVLTALAVLEHWFLVLPVPIDALWNWGMRSRRTPATTITTHTEPLAVLRRTAA